MSKTFIYPMFGSVDGVKTTIKVMGDTMNQNAFRMHKHQYDDRVGVSPHILKCTYYNGERYQMGKCKYTMQEID